MTEAMATDDLSERAGRLYAKEPKLRKLVANFRNARRDLRNEKENEWATATRIRMAQSEYERCLGKLLKLIQDVEGSPMSSGEVAICVWCFCIQVSLVILSFWLDGMFKRILKKLEER